MSNPRSSVEDGLTMEDKRIFLMRVPMGASFSYRAADHADALNMSVREDEKKRSTFSWEAWATHRREWFPSRWGGI